VVESSVGRRSERRRNVKSEFSILFVTNDNMGRVAMLARKRETPDMVARLFGAVENAIVVRVSDGHAVLGVSGFKPTIDQRSEAEEVVGEVVVVENIAGELDRRVGDGERAGCNRVDSGVVGDFEAWTRVGTGVGGVTAKVMGIASTNEDVGGATI
jgi:hypothetical protein